MVEAQPKIVFARSSSECSLSWPRLMRRDDAMGRPGSCEALAQDCKRVCVSIVKVEASLNIGLGVPIERTLKFEAALIELACLLGSFAVPWCLCVWLRYRIGTIDAKVQLSLKRRRPTMNCSHR